MSAIFEEMDRLAAEKFAESPAATFDMRPRSPRAEEENPQPVEELPDAIAVGVGQYRETFDTGAVRDTTNYRYDLIPAPIVLSMLRSHPKACKFVIGFFRYVEGLHHLEWDELADLLGVQTLDLMHFYAKALHEGAIKYGERNWERGLPESNLLNHALYHLFKLVGGDDTENHQAHLVWNVMTLVYQRVTDYYRELQNTIKETTNHESESQEPHRVDSDIPV